MMQFGRDVGISLGILAGTTLASGLAFLMRLEPVSMIWTVSLGGVSGAAVGIAATFALKRWTARR
ncbi:hypothetical protein [Paenibacillus chibensis]|uniref:hypothetical protein n=2 Tax=Paenibacillus chibensis TaxID=59846 RepID=UPI003D28CAE4